MSSAGDIAAPLHAYLRREIDALTALAQTCSHVATAGPSVRCAIVANESKGERVLTPATSEADARVIERVVTRANGRRLLLDRESAGEDFEDTDAAFAVSEPLTTRSGVYLGAIAAIGAMVDREAVLGDLPAAGRVCSDVALELLLGIHLGRKLHAFNNTLSVLTANLEYVTDAIAATNGIFPDDEREQIVIASGHAARGAQQLIQAAVDLREGLPTEDRSRSGRARRTAPSLPGPTVEPRREDEEGPSDGRPQDDRSR